MLSKGYISKNWIVNKYKGYQISSKYPLIDSQKSQTPKGLAVLGKVGYALSYFIASYKGGRNESFMYGYDDKIHWYDLDLCSCYSILMYMLQDLNYKLTSTVESELIKN